jgi:hypothetical protein
VVSGDDRCLQHLRVCPALEGQAVAPLLSFGSGKLEGGMITGYPITSVLVPHLRLGEYTILNDHLVDRV